MKIENRKKLGDVIKEYKEKNTDNKYKPVAVGRYGIRKREDIYSKELAKDYSKNKLIYKNTLTVGMGSKQIDIGILTEDEIYAVSPAYHTFRINNIDANYLRYCLDACNADMPKPESSDGKGTGYVDYVLYGANGDIIALIEAKRTSLDARKGTHQAELYAECIKVATGKKPLIFNTNGFETYLWDKESGPQRPVSGLFSEEDIQHLINLREMRKPLSEIKINEAITDRYYQKAAIRAVCENVEKGLRRSLLVMATGTGKTRVAASLTDVLSRGGYVTNVLFLADRKALVRQAKAAFMEYLGSTN